MRYRVALAALVALLIVIGLAPQTGRGTTVAEYCLGPTEIALVNAINQYRSANGIGPLRADQELGAAAQHHSVDMATTFTFSHTLSDGTTWVDNIIAHGYTTYGRAEILAWGYQSVDAVLAAWKASPTHNAAMLGSNYGAAGLSLVTTSDTQRFYWTVTFGPVVEQSAVTCGQSAPTPTRTSVATVLPPPATVVPDPTETPKPCRGNNGRWCR
jgi:uncharacterized protein YkwD